MNDLITITDCKNCGQQIEKYNFCPDCGAKKITKRITFKNLIAEASEKYLNVDNTLLKTIRDLFIKPDKVIDGYVNGQRKKYINVTSYFLISLTLSGILLFVVRKILHQNVTIISKTSKNPEAIESIFNLTYDYQGVISFLFIPIYALISKLVFFNYKKYNYTEHIVINMYLNAHILIVTFIPYLVFVMLGYSYTDVSFPLLIALIIYALFVFKRIYNLTAKQLIIKTLLFVLISSVILSIFSVIVALIAVVVMKGKGTL